MSSALSVPGVEVAASCRGCSGQVLTAGGLELLAALHRIFGLRCAELAGPGVVRSAELAGRRCPTSWPGRRTCGRTAGGRPRWPRVWPIAGSRSPVLADRKMVISALDCDAKIFVAGVEDSNVPLSDHLVTGHDAGAWESRCLSHASRKCSTHRYRACRSHATSLTHPAAGSGISPGWPL